MVNYQNGKIYKITSVSTTDIYVGSTTTDLDLRMNQHKYQLKKNKEYVSSFEILKYGDAKIELIVNFPCDSKTELTREEGKYIRQLDCVNKNIAGRTNKEYNVENKEQIAKKSKEYYHQNKEQIAKTLKNYRDTHKEQQKEYYYTHKEQIKEYYQQNKEQIAKQQKEYYEKTKGEKAVCSVCGVEILKRSLLRHTKNKHNIQ